MSYAVILSVTPASINAIGRFYNVGTSVLGFLYFVQFGSFLVAVMGGGWISDTRGKLPVVAVGCVLMVLGAVLFAFAQTIAILFIAMLLFGSGGGFAEGVATAIVADLYKGNKRTAMLNLSHVVFALGAISAPIGVARLFQLGIDWQVAYVGAAVLCALSTVIAVVAAGQRRERPTARSEDNWRGLIRDPLILWLSLGLFLYVGAELGQGTWLAAYFERDIGSSPALAALTVAFFWAGISGGRATAAWLSKYASDIVIIWGALAMGAICQAALLLMRDTVPGIVLVTALGFCHGPVWPTVLSIAAAAHPRQSGAVFGIVIAAGALGAVVFPAVIGAAADVTGLRSALWICFVILTLNFALFSRMRRNAI